MNLGSLIRSIRSEERKRKIVRTYSEKNRFIPTGIYHELKLKKKCDHCKKKAEGLKIHHKVPVSKGGLNERSNLMVVCKECHEILDKQAMEVK